MNALRHDQALRRAFLRWPVAAALGVAAAIRPARSQQAVQQQAQGQAQGQGQGQGQSQGQGQGQGDAAAASTFDEIWIDERRQRALPLRVRLPAQPASGDPGCALVLYSHGLGGSLAAGEVWARAWQAAGLAVIHLQHPGSDSETARGGLAALLGAANLAQLQARVADVQFVLTECARRAAVAPWSRLRLDAVGLAGHSFGAQTTLALAGARGNGPDLTDTAGKLRAFIALSPAPARHGRLELSQQFGAITRPMLCITGTLDGDPISAGVQAAGAAAPLALRGARGISPEDRRAVYDGLPSSAQGQRALLVLDQADHASFAGQDLLAAVNGQPTRSPDGRPDGRPDGGRGRLLGQREPETLRLQPLHHARVAAISTDWWRAHLLADAAAQQRLRQPQGLEARDLWQRD